MDHLYDDQCNLDPEAVREHCQYIPDDPICQ